MIKTISKKFKKKIRKDKKFQGESTKKIIDLKKIYK